ncbi:MAG TPA: 6-phosphogluconolactonase, partial [Oscillatoriaceae cyanobacterium]
MSIKLHVYPDHDTMSRAVAVRLLAQLHEKPESVLALPSGKTPETLYAHLVDAGKHGAHFERVRLFALDEYLGLGADDPRSFAAFFRQQLYGPLGLPPERARVLDGRARDPKAECAAYEKAIADAGGLDLTLLGLGANGHIAFNEPATALQARTHVTPLAPPAST